MTVTSSGIPTARHHFPAGTDGDTCIQHKRTCKVARIVLAALNAGYDSEIIDEEITVVADRAGVRAPGSEETRAAVRAGLIPPLTDADPNQTFTEAVMSAGADGHPFRYTTHDGRTVLLVPIPVGE